MCGLTGVISKQSIDLCHIQKMNNTLIHRGPNSYGYLSTRDNTNTHKVDQIHYLDLDHSVHFAFGHRRLAIHDLSIAGNQPMSYLDRYWILFNGEIYNFLEIRAELEKKGYQFKSNTDTEVIMAAYDCWGRECLNKFNGDWIILLVDILKNKIFLARDRFGVKPLYYFLKEGLFVFGSEIKAILEYPGVTREPNLSYIKDYLRSGAKEYLKETAFKDIYRFDFSSYFEGDLKDLLFPEKFELKKFWRLEPSLSRESLDESKLSEYAKKYYDLIEDAVRIRLRSDVKIGTSLSGGLDSSSILYLIKNLKQKNKTQIEPECFSSVYHTPGTLDCDESSLINEMAGFLKIQSNQIEPQVEDIPTEHHKMIYHLETPPDSTLMSSWYTAKLQQKSNVTVTLTGEGADEQLAGYLRYIVYYFSNLRLREILVHYHAFKNIAGARLYIWVGVSANFLKAAVGKRLAQIMYTFTGRKEKLFTPVNEKLEQDLLGSLVTLHHIDERTFMAHSIEQRAPFMDYRLVEFLASVPTSYKLAKGWTKYLARHAFNHSLPQSINWSKKKQGWPIPERFWFEGDLKIWMQNKIKESSFLKQHKFLTRNASKISLTKRIRLLNVAVWYDVFFLSGTKC